MKIVVKEGDSGQWYLRLVAANGEARMHSETYDSKYNAQRAADDLAMELSADHASVVVEVVGH